MATTLTDYIGARHAQTLKIIGLAPPTGAGDPATKQYVDAGSALTTTIEAVVPLYVVATGLNSATIGSYAASGTVPGYVDGASNTLAGDFVFTGYVIVDTAVVNNTSDSVDLTTGALIVDTNAIIEKQLHVGDSLTLHNATHSAIVSVDSSGTGLITATGGVLTANLFTVLNTTDAADVTSGAFQTRGGAAIVKKLNVGDLVEVIDDTDSTTVGNGAVVTAGGISATGRIRSGTDITVTGSVIAPNAYASSEFFSDNETVNRVVIQNSSNTTLNASMTVDTSSNIVFSSGMLLPTDEIGAVPSVLDYYESYTSGPQSVQGPWAVNPTISLVIEQIGKIVHFGFGSYSEMATVAGQPILVVGYTFPARFWPSATMMFPIYVVNGGELVRGNLLMFYDGGLQIEPAPKYSTFDTGSLAGWGANTVTYVLP